MYSSWYLKEVFFILIEYIYELKLKKGKRIRKLYNISYNPKIKQYVNDVRKN